MEHQTPKRSEKYGGDDDVAGSGSDRLSRLPDSVLHHILCFLSQKKAVQTCVLSKSWRHLGPTRPVIDLRVECGIYRQYPHVRVEDKCFRGEACENCFQGNRETFLSVLDNTFQRYHHQSIFTRELSLELLTLNSKSISLLEKWIPVMFIKPNACVNVFRISVARWTDYFLPSVVFKVESLRELYLEGCRLKEIDSVVLRNLRKLYLRYVDIDGETLENIMSGCPLVEYVTLVNCKGLETFSIIADKNHYLKYFEFCCYHEQKDIEHSIAIDVPTLQSIRIIDCSEWYHNLRNYFPHLKSLYLSRVKLSTDSFDNFSWNFPHLEELTLLDCSVFEEINLYSRSIKHLIIDSRRLIKKVAIEVPNIKYFEFSGNYNLPTTFSLTTTSSEWKSQLNVHSFLYAYDDDVLPMILQLFEMVKALSQSQISLSIYEKLFFKINQTDCDFNVHPVVVEHLGLDIIKLCPKSLAHFLNALFRIFRPRYTNALRLYPKDDEEVTKFLWNTLIHERGKTEYGWEQHLEDVSIEASDGKGKVWHHVQGKCLPEWPKYQKIRFRLKWRD